MRGRLEVVRQASGPVAVDLSFVDFVGARALEAVIHSIPPWQLTAVNGIQAPVARLLALINMELSVPGAHRALSR